MRESFRKYGLIAKKNTCTLVHTEFLTCLVRNWYRCVMFDGSLAPKLAEGIWDSSIYGSGVAIIRRPAKSGAKRDGVGPIPAKIRIDIWKKGRKTSHRYSKSIRFYDRTVAQNLTTIVVAIYL